jgi:hypothetical protein
MPFDLSEIDVLAASGQPALPGRTECPDRAARPDERGGSGIAANGRLSSAWPFGLHEPPAFGVERIIDDELALQNLMIAQPQCAESLRDPPGPLPA